MLWSAGIPLPSAVFGHGFVTAADGQKMSKSIGNVVDPNDVLQKCPPDSFRYGVQERLSARVVVRMHTRAGIT